MVARRRDVAGDRVLRGARRAHHQGHRLLAGAVRAAAGSRAPRRTAQYWRVMQPDRNVLGGDLEPCGTDPLTGFYRDGCCTTGPEDFGSHTICAVVSAEF